MHIYINSLKNIAFEQKKKTLNSMISVEKFSDEEKENKFDSNSSESIEEINNHLSWKNIQSND